MKKNKIIVTIFIVGISVLGVVAGRWYLTDGFSVRQSFPRAKGSPSAPIHIVEYTDYQCPACRRTTKQLHELMEQHPQAIYLEHRHYPLRTHRHSLAASIFAECAGRQEKFWEFSDLLFERQPLWARLSNPRDIFLEIADEVGLNKEKLTNCVLDPEVEAAVMEDKEEGRSRGVRSTPTFFVNGEILVGSSNLFKKLDKQIRGGDGQN